MTRSITLFILSIIFLTVVAEVRAEVNVCETSLAIVNESGAVEHPFVIEGKLVLVKEEDFSERIVPLPHKVSTLFSVSDGETSCAAIYYGANSKATTVDDQLGGFDLYAYSLRERQPRLVMGEQSVLTASWNRAGRFLMIWTRDFDLYILREANAKLVKVASRVALPSVSPEGSRIAFTRLPMEYQHGNLPGFSTLGVLDLLNGKEQSILTGMDINQPLWSRDGKKIIFFSKESPEQAAFWSVNRDGSGLIQISQPFSLQSYQSVSASLSRDGRKLLLSKLTQNGQQEILICRFNRTGGPAAFSFLGVGTEPRWTADDSRYICASQEENSNNSQPRFVKGQCEGRAAKATEALFSRK